jgi:type IV pilus assembly protein PilM
LDLGHDSIKMMQLEASENSLSVVAAAKQSLPEEARRQPELSLAVAMDLVRQMLRGHSFSGRSIITSLPREMVHAKNLRLPMMPPAEVESAVEFEAKNIFPFDTDDAVIRHLPAGEVRQGNDSKLEVIALAARKQEIDTFVEQLHRAGCIVESLDFEPNAVYRGVERFVRRREDENEVNVLVDIGTNRTQVIIGKGRDISFFKTIDIGSIKLQDDVSRKLSITFDEARALRRRLIESTAEVVDSPAAGDPVRQAVHDAIRSTAEELAREISLCLRYYSVTFRGQRPGKIRLLGGEGGDPLLLSILAGALPIPVQAGRPLLSVNTDHMKPADRRGTMSEWAVAFGLGLKMTHGYFGSLDGKKRQTGFAQTGVSQASPGQTAPAQSPATAAGSAEIIDPARPVAQPAPPREPEVANA